jgi:hypothetical protein
VAEFATPVDESGLATAGTVGLATTGDGTRCSFALEPPAFASGEFKSTEGAVVGLACTPVFAAELGVPVTVALVSDGVDGDAAAAAPVAAGVAATAGVVTATELLA